MNTTQQKPKVKITHHCDDCGNEVTGNDACRKHPDSSISSIASPVMTSGGGKRKNAGRKPSGKSYKTLSCMADVTVCAQIAVLAEDRGLSISQWLLEAAKAQAAKQLMGVM